MGGRARKYILASAAAIILLLTVPLQAAPGPLDFQAYRAAFTEFVHLPSNNPLVPQDDLDAMAAVFWGVSGGEMTLSVRLAAKGSAESQYRLLLWLPNGHPPKGIPRTDPLGLHYPLLAQEAWRAGLLPSWRDWYTSDNFQRFKEQLVRDPVLGAWLGARAYVRFARKLGMNPAEKVWAESPTYLETVLKKEREFNRILSGGRAPSSPPRRKR